MVIAGDIVGDVSTIMFAQMSCKLQLCDHGTAEALAELVRRATDIPGLGGVAPALLAMHRRLYM